MFVNESLEFVPELVKTYRCLHLRLFTAVTLVGATIVSNKTSHFD